MKDWKKILIHPGTPIFEAVKIIDAGALQIALVVEEDSRLVGVITDGDVRRGLLRGLPLDRPVHLIMNRNFKTAPLNTTQEEIVSMMKKRELRHIPILDEKGRIVDLKILNDLLLNPERGNWVLLMAGGLGTRLKPLTEDCPKPLLKVGSKPVLETILKNFIEHGFKKYFISVNYKAEMIEDYFGNGSRWGVDLRFLRESEHLGTAGALSLFPERPSSPFIVMNGDVLTKVNPGHLLDFHKAHKVRATMCVRAYDFQVPYGVVKLDQHLIAGIDEKPVQKFFVNAGIYVLEPEVLDFVPTNTFFDMTSLFEKLISIGQPTAAFPVREYWIDIGRIKDYDRANGEYSEAFE